jgi:Zn-dependent M28 family amino/carboxypeptidase
MSKPILSLVQVLYNKNKSFMQRRKDAELTQRKFLRILCPTLRKPGAGSLRALFFFGFGLLCACEQPSRFPSNRASTPELAASDIQYHVNYLASDSLEGRLSGAAGCEKAAGYLAEEFKRFGLQPLGDNGSYEQKFDFVGGVNLGPGNQLTLWRDGSDTTLALKADFIPAGFSASDSVSGDVVFVGYGIAAEKLNYDEYANADLNGKIALALRYSPASNNPHTSFAEYEPMRYKALQARQHGAKALLVIANADSATEPLPKLRFDRSATDAGLPVAYITAAAADWLLAEAGKSVKDLKTEINKTQKPASFAIAGSRAIFRADLKQERRATANIIGKLAGSDPQLKEQAVIIGAHYDHLGRSSEGALDPEKEGEIRNGADDNASGTSGVLELAQYFAAQSPRPRRSLIFTAFSGEELGLLGSAHYVNHPAVPLEQTVAMINMDMIGRMKDSTLVVQGVGTAPQWPPLIERLHQQQFKLSLKKEGPGPSDHSSFYQKNIPVLFFFTNQHEDYHRVTDDAEKINVHDEARILRFISQVVTEIANQDSTLHFTKAESQQPAVRGFRVSVGTIPDYAAEVEGMKISGVRQGSPAEKAGLQGGDIIIKFGKFDIKNVYDYTYALGEFSPGEKVPVVVKRGNQTVTLAVTLERSQRQ